LVLTESEFSVHTLQPPVAATRTAGTIAAALLYAGSLRKLVHS